MTAILALAIGVILGAVAGYWLACRRLAHRVAGLQAALTAIPRTPATADYRREVAASYGRGRRRFLWRAAA